MDFTESELFKNLLETKNEFLHLDLHNDFTCVGIAYSNDILDLKFQDDKGHGYVTVHFSEVVILKLEMPLKNLTIDNFHRGRYELNGELYDDMKVRNVFILSFSKMDRLSCFVARRLFNFPIQH